MGTTSVGMIVLHQKNDEEEAEMVMIEKIGIIEDVILVVIVIEEDSIVEIEI